VKVSELKERLSRLKDDDDVFVLMYEKGSFDFDPDDELWLPPEKWAQLVWELEEIPFANLWEDVHSAVLDYAEINPNFKEEPL